MSEIFPSVPTHIIPRPAHGSPSKRTHSRPPLNSPAFLLPDTALLMLFSAAAQLALYHAVKLSADDARAARLALALRYICSPWRRERSRTSRCPTSLACLPAAHVVPPTVPRLAVLGPGLVTTLIPGRLLRRVTLRIASTLYDGLRPVTLLGVPGNALKKLGLVLAPDVDVRPLGVANRA
ncbi:hypothetical protein EDB84DRAFT_1567580 [Lactarius hengduanensis]|nr:hypothetical protein EDB84DRAFT_1567580 [Lactarius hengduanensis]